MSDLGLDRHVVKMIALDPRFQLGNLYDYRSDQILKGNLLLESTDLSSSVLVENQFELKLECSDYVDGCKLEQMGLDEHLQVSVMADLIEKYRRAANYRNELTSSRQVKKVLICRAKCRKEAMDLEALVRNQAIIRRLMAAQADKGKKVKSNVSTATHVVVGLVYGAEVYCVLSQDLVNAKDLCERKNWEKRVSKTLNEMKIALEERCESSDFNDQFEKSRKMNDLKCRLYSDVASHSGTECTTSDAYKECLKIIQTLEKSGSNQNGKAVPIKVLLCPLKTILEPAESGMILQYHDVNKHLVARCRRLSTKMETVGSRLETLRSNTAKKKEREYLDQFANCLERYTDLYRDELKKALVCARTTGDDSQMINVVRIAETHALFKPSKLNRWLRLKEIETRVALKMAQTFGAPLMTRKAMLNKLLDSPDKEYALVFNLPFPRECFVDTISKMEDYLDNYATLVAIENELEDGDQLTDSEDDGECDVEDNSRGFKASGNIPWILFKSNRRRMMDKVQQLVRHRDRNGHLEENVHFFVAIAESDAKDCHYSVYQNGKVLKDNMAELPTPPANLKLLSQQSNENKVIKTETAIGSPDPTLIFQWNYKDLGFPYSLLVERRSKKSFELWTRQQVSVDYDKNQTTIIPTNEELPLEVRMAVDTCIGRSKFSRAIFTDEVQKIDDSKSKARDSLKKRSENIVKQSSRKTITPPLVSKPVRTDRVQANAHTSINGGPSKETIQSSASTGKRKSITKTTNGTTPLTNDVRKDSERNSTTRSAGTRQQSSISEENKKKPVSARKSLDQVKQKDPVNKQNQINTDNKDTASKAKNDDSDKTGSRLNQINRRASLQTTRGSRPVDEQSVKTKSRQSMVTTNTVKTVKGTPAQSSESSAIVLKAEFISSNGARLVWSHGPSESGIRQVAKRYRVRYWTEGQDVSLATKSDMEAKLPIYRLAGLQPNTKYLAAIVPLSDDGEESGDPSNVVQFATLPGSKINGSARNPPSKASVNNKSVATCGNNSSVKKGNDCVIESSSVKQ